MITIPFRGHELHARLAPNPYPRTKNCCIFYFHGGGLIFGSMNDLPKVYEDLFLKAGYDLVYLDYPLAPESSLSEILEGVHTSVTYLLTHPEKLGYEETPSYILFGRSAGSYLALMEAKKLITSSLPTPRNLLCFYGYHSFDLPEFSRPAYTKQAEVTDDVLNHLIQNHFITEGDGSRFLIYLYGRQKGGWKKMIGVQEKENNSHYCLEEKDFTALPPGFFTASSADQDVPFRESKQMARKIPGSKFVPVYYAEHDFDRDTSKKDGLKVYQAAISWLAEN